MFRSVLLPLDGSSFAEEALPLAAWIARDSEADLHLVHVIRPAPDVDFKTPEEDLNWRTRVREAASGALGERVARLRRDGVLARAEVREGKVADALLESAAEHGVDLVVLTTHGAGGFRRWWLGSVADALLRKGDLPLLLVRPWDDTEDRPSTEARFQRVVVPLDGSLEAESAIPHARWLRERQGAQVTLVRVVPSPLEVGTLYGIPSVRLERDTHRTQRDAALAYLKEMGGRLGPADAGPEPELRVVEASSAAEGILDAARTHRADLLVLSTLGRSGMGRAVVGSVADKVIRGAAVPVLAVRPAGRE